MTQNLYKTITKAAILSAAFSGYASAEEQKNLLDSRIDILDNSGNPVAQEQTYKGNFTVPVQLNITNTPLTPFPLAYAGHLCIYPAAVLEDSSLEGDTPLACQDIAEKTYAVAKDLEGVENESINFQELGDVVEGRYALVSQGKINGTIENKITAAYFTVEAEPLQEAPSEPAATDNPTDNPFAFYGKTTWPLKVGRYGANWIFPKWGYALRGVSITVDENKKPVVALDHINLPHNFELKVFGTPDFYEMLTREEGKQYGEALFAIHAEAASAPDKSDIGKSDTEINQGRGAVTELFFNEPYEVKQVGTQRNGVGRSFVQFYLQDPSTVEFAGQTFSVDVPNTFQLVKVGYEDKDKDGKFTEADTVLGLDEMVVDIHNKTPNPWLITGGGIVGTALTYFLIDALLDNGRNGTGPHGLGPQDDGNDDDDDHNQDHDIGSGDFGGHGTGTERLRGK